METIKGFPKKMDSSLVLIQELHHTKRFVSQWGPYVNTKFFVIHVYIEILKIIHMIFMARRYNQPYYELCLLMELINMNKPCYIVKYMS